jgi:YD repeat-containing protein
MDEPEFGDYVWVYWLVGTQFGAAGKITGNEYDQRMENVLTAGYGVLTERPDTPGAVPTNPNAGISAAKVQELIDGLDFLTAAEGNATYAPAFPTTGITYDGSGNVQTVTENGVTTTYTYNGDGTVHTDTRLGVTRTYTYDGSGNLTGIAS